MTGTAVSPSSNLLSVTRPEDPYPGLRPFDEKEWMIFFGREKMIEDVIERLARQLLVFIHGASGSGKSSLVRAGVLPKLEDQHRCHGEEWHTFTIRPSGGPLWNLAQKFAEFEVRSDEFVRVERVDEIERLFDLRDATLASVAGQIQGLAGKRLCILVDQFEELFRFEREINRDEAELFIDLLIGEVNTTSESDDDEFGPPAPPPPVNERHARVHIVVTMRSEFLGECTRFDGLAEAINRTQYLVPRMSHEALLRAIQRPSQIYGGEVTIELAERLIAEVRGREDELPLIQHGLMLLWDTASAKSNEKIILDVGLLDKGVSLASLLSNHADEIMETVAPDLRRSRAVENLFRALIEQTPKKQAIRRPQQFKELAAISNIDAQELKTIIDAFRENGVSFLTPSQPTEIKDETTIDTGHEALNRCWKKIADQQDGWLTRETEDGKRWSLLLAEAKEFAINPKRVLSHAKVRDVKHWFATKAKPWCNRYGGNWDLVDKLLKVSGREARSIVLIKAFITMTGIGMVGGICFGIISSISDLKAEDLINANEWIFIQIGMFYIIYFILIVIIAFRVIFKFIRTIVFI